MTDTAATTEGTAAAWVGEAAHRREHKEEQQTPWTGYPATFLLLAINIVVYAWMFRTGPVPALLRQHAFAAALTAPFGIEQLIQFGGSDPTLVLHSGGLYLTHGHSYFLLEGQWWRLLTATFVHVTFVHLAINMWCLWNLGLFGEPLLGKPGLCAVYMLTGVAGNMLSLAWSVFTRTESVVVGASGAVFGIAGILIVLLSNRGLVKDDLTWDEVRGLRRQVILFAVVNLLFGMAPNFLPLLGPAALRAIHLNPHTMMHVDNKAHVGGFAAGLLLGLPLFSRMVKGKRVYRARQRVTFVSAALALCLFGYAIASFAGK